MPNQDDYADDNPSHMMSTEELAAKRFARVREKYKASDEGVALDKYIAAAAAAGLLPPPSVVYGPIKAGAGSNAPRASASSVSGVYASSDKIPGGIVGIHENILGSPTAPSTMTHEMVHAAQDRMSVQVNNKKYTSPQYKDAYRKLGLDSAALAKAISSSWVKKDRAVTDSLYRTTAPELAAFGVGNSVIPQHMRDAGAINNPAPPHVDATAAQEFMILLDLATRNLRAGATKK